MSSPATRIWAALSAAAAVALLIGHFQIPARLPGANSPPAAITRLVRHHHAGILATAWRHGSGPFPYLLVALGWCTRPAP